VRGSNVLFSPCGRIWQRPHGRRDLLHYRLNVLEHVVVPESQDAESAFVQKRAALLVLLLTVRVLAAIQLDYELGFDAAEVHDVRSDGFLPPKLRVRYLPRPEVIPESVLDVCGVPPETPRARDLRRMLSCHCLARGRWRAGSQERRRCASGI